MYPLITSILLVLMQFSLLSLCGDDVHILKMKCRLLLRIGWAVTYLTFLMLQTLERVRVRIFIYFKLWSLEKKWTSHASAGRHMIQLDFTWFSWASRFSWIWHDSAGRHMFQLDVTWFSWTSHDSAGCHMTQLDVTCFSWTSHYSAGHYIRMAPRSALVKCKLLLTVCTNYY